MRAETKLEMPDAIGIVDEPPKTGLPHMAVMLIDGEIVMCEPVGSVEEGETFLTRLVPKLPSMIAEFRGCRRPDNDP